LRICAFVNMRFHHRCVCVCVAHCRYSHSICKLWRRTAHRKSFHCQGVQHGRYPADRNASCRRHPLPCWIHR